MNYRLYEKDDFDRVDKLCKQFKLPFPANNQFLVIAEDDLGEIVSICGLKPELKVEPLIGKNSLANNNLLRMVEGIAIGQGITKLYAEIPKDNERHLNHAEKDGWIIVSNDRIKLEKSYG